MSVNDVQTGRFGDDGPSRPNAGLDQPLHAEERVFFVDRASQDEIGSARGFLARQPGERGQHRRHASFDVAGATPIQPAILDPRGKRINRHIIGRHRVLMNFEKNRGVGPSRRIDTGDDVIAQRRHRLPLVAYPQAAEKIFQIGGDPMLVDLRSP